MVHSPLLDSFDPFATHPFTNGSGLAPQPPLPSAYPVPLPSPLIQAHYPGTLLQYPTTLTSSSPMTSTSAMQSSPPLLRSPQPQRPAPSSPGQIFVPFRKDSSSPDLVLKKKSPMRSHNPSQCTK